MNVLDIPKQNNTPLSYTHHAMDRAFEREVPIPKYLPKNSKCLKIENTAGQLRYTISYFYNDDEYCLILSDAFKVVTVYALHVKSNSYKSNERKSNRQEIKDLFKKVEKMVLLDDYICLESEVYNYHNYA
jgi:hypothetical protein